MLAMKRENTSQCQIRAAELQQAQDQEADSEEEKDEVMCRGWVVVGPREA